MWARSSSRKRQFRKHGQYFKAKPISHFLGKATLSFLNRQAHTLRIVHKDLTDNNDCVILVLP